MKHRDYSVIRHAGVMLSICSLFLFAGVADTRGDALQDSTRAQLAVAYANGTCPSGNEFKVDNFYRDSGTGDIRVRCTAYYKNVAIAGTFCLAVVGPNGAVTLGKHFCGVDASQTTVNLDSILSPDSITSILLNDSLRREGSIEYTIDAYSGIILEKLCPVICEFPPYNCCPGFSGPASRTITTAPSLIIELNSLCYKATVTIEPFSPSKAAYSDRTGKSIYCVITKSKQLMLRHIPGNHAQLTMFSIEGKKILAKNLNSQQGGISLAAFKPGFYLLEISNEYGTMHRHVILQ